MDEKGSFYFDIPKQERECSISFLLNAILKSRDACHLPSNQGRFDEDVNIYLAHLLFAASLSDYENAIQRYLSKNISDMKELIDRNEDRIVRYFIYKVNADHLMIHLGIFQDLDSGRDKFSKTQQQFISMAKNYYGQAATYNRKIYRRETAVGSVLEKLSDGFQKYQTILRFARKDFFHFSNKFQDEPFQQFCSELDQYEKEIKLNQAIDQFLDSYANWIKDKGLKAQLNLMEHARKLQAIDPHFNFRFDLNMKEAA